MAGFPKGDKVLGAKAKRPHPGVPINSNTVLELIPKTRGNLSRIADLIGCARSTIQDKVNREPILKQAISDARERFVDDLEDCCEYDAVNNPKAETLRIFLLKTRGRARGYEQTEDKYAAQDIARAAFEFVLNKTANPAES